MLVLRVLPSDLFGDPRLTWRAAGPDDAGFLKALFDADSRSMFLSLDLPSAMIDLMVETQWSARLAGYAAVYPAAVDLIIAYDETPVGRFLLTQDGDRLHLIDLMLSARARNQGIGSQVLTAAQALASDLGLRRVTLSVALTNTGAQRLYHRLGFRADPMDDLASLSLSMTYVVDADLSDRI